MINQNRIRIAMLLILWAGVFLLAPFPVWAEESPEALLKQVEELEREVEKLKAKEANYDFLKEETKAYRELVEREWDRFLHVVEWFLPLLGALITFVLTFFNWQTARNVKKSVEEKTKELADERFKEISQKIVDEESGKLERKIETLESMIKRELWHLDSRILVLQQPSSEMDEILSSYPFNKNMECIVDRIPSDELAPLLKKGEVDIIVYEYPKNEGQSDSYIKGILDMLNSSSKVVPIIIYYTGQERLQNKDLESYEWLTFANGRLTLSSHIHSLAHVLCSDQKSMK
jgi:hypothetical protein